MGDCCYCSKRIDEILKDMFDDSVSDDALLRSCCWSKICSVNWRMSKYFDRYFWSELCRRRGYLLKSY